MLFARIKPSGTLILFTSLLLLMTVIPATAGLNDLLGKKEIDEPERKETIERIESIQQKLKLLQDKLRVLERRKAAKQESDSTSGADVISSAPVQINWQPVDETTVDPGHAGFYTYLLFSGEITETPAVGSLEDFILTIETLPDSEIPGGLANRFLVPVEKPQSIISLGRQPYDFKLNQSYLRRLELQDDLHNGPVLVTLCEPLDPYGSGELPAFLAVSLGRQAPQRVLELARIWHSQESNSVSSDEQLLDELFWKLIDGAGPTQVIRYQQRTLVAMPQK